MYTRSYNSGIYTWERKYQLCMSYYRKINNQLKKFFSVSWDLIISPFSHVPESESTSPPRRFPWLSKGSSLLHPQPISRNVLTFLEHNFHHWITIYLRFPISLCCELLGERVMSCQISVQCSVLLLLGLLESFLIVCYSPWNIFFTWF